MEMNESLEDTPTAVENSWVFIDSNKEENLTLHENASTSAVEDIKFQESNGNGGKTHIESDTDSISVISEGECCLEEEDKEDTVEQNITTISSTDQVIHNEGEDNGVVQVQNQNDLAVIQQSSNIRYKVVNFGSTSILLFVIIALIVQYGLTNNSENFNNFGFNLKDVSMSKTLNDKKDSHEHILPKNDKINERNEMNYNKQKIDKGIKMKENKTNVNYDAKKSYIDKVKKLQTKENYLRKKEKYLMKKEQNLNKAAKLLEIKKEKSNKNKKYFTEINLNKYKKVENKKFEKSRNKKEEKLYKKKQFSEDKIFKNKKRNTFKY